MVKKYVVARRRVTKLRPIKIRGTPTPAQAKSVVRRGNTRKRKRREDRAKRMRAVLDYGK